MIKRYSNQEMIEIWQMERGVVPMRRATVVSRNDGINPEGVLQFITIGLGLGCCLGAGELILCFQDNLVKNI